MNIAIIGAGQVGSTLAFLLLEKQLGDVILIDVARGVAEGKALDLMQAGSLVGFKNSVTGTDKFSMMEEVKVCVITAGFPRKPGMSRLDLLRENAQVVGSVAHEISTCAPESIIIVVTNPLDTMTYLALKRSGFRRERVIGQAGILDVGRFKYFISRELSCNPSEISTFVLGGHGDTMVPVVSHTKVSGENLEELLTEEKILQLVDETRSSGAQIVSLLKTGSAYYAPAMSVYLMIDSIVRDRGEILPCSVYLEGEYGIDGVCVGVPVRLGKEGVREILEIPLSDKEKKALHSSAETYKDSIREII